MGMWTIFGLSFLGKLGILLLVLEQSEYVWYTSEEELQVEL